MGNQDDLFPAKRLEAFEMARNVEVKAKVNDHRELRRITAALADGDSTILEQTDTFFSIQRGRLKLREIQDSGAELIYYERPNRSGPKTSTYDRYPVSDPNTLLGFLSKALGAIGVVKKQRELFLVGRTRVHLDNVEGLGSFMELEVVLHPEESVADGEIEAQKLMDNLGIKSSDLVSVAYVDLLTGESNQES